MPQPRLPVPPVLWEWGWRRDTTSLYRTCAAQDGRQAGLPVKMSHSTSRSRATNFSFLQNFLCIGQLARWHATPQ